MTNTLKPEFRPAEKITADTPKHPVGSDPTFKIVGMRPKPQAPELPHLHLSQQDDYYNDLMRWYEELEEHPHVQEVMKIPTDEPIFVMRSQDIYATEAVDYWLQAAQTTVGPDKFSSAAGRYKEMLEWQNVEPTRAKIPD